MGIIIEVSVALVALAFVALVIVVIRTLSSVKETLDQANQTLLDVKEQVNELSTEATELIRNTNKLTVDIKEKSEKMDAMFYSMQDLGIASQQITASIKQVSTTISNSVKSMTEPAAQKQDKFSELMRYATLGIKFWQDWQARKVKRAEQVHNEDVSDHIKR